MPSPDSEDCQLYRFTLVTIERQKETVIVESPTRSEAIEFVKYKLLPRAHIREISRITEQPDTIKEEHSTVYHVHNTSNATQTQPQSPTA